MIEEKYKQLCETPSDVNFHLPTIRKYVSQGDIVVELGVRHVVSTWALLANKPKALISVDVEQPPAQNLAEAERAAKEIGTDFRFLKQDSTKVLIEPYIDVLFVDTLHLYSHLVKELWRHAENTRKYIIFHDYGIPEVGACIQDFMFNPNWKWVEINGEGTKLAVVGRV